MNDVKRLTLSSGLLLECAAACSQLVDEEERAASEKSPRKSIGKYIKVGIFSKEAS